MSLLSASYNLAVLGRLRDDPGPFDPSRVRSILVVRNDNIGDVICTTPAIAALREAFPQAHLAALVCTLTREALEGHPALDELFVYPKAKHRHYGPLASHLKLMQVLGEIRRRRFDLAIAFRADFSSSQAWLVYASGARWRLGPEARGRRRRWGFYYNLPVPWAPAGTHEVLRCFHLLGHIQVDSPSKRLYLKVPERPQVEKLLSSRGMEDLRPLVVNLTRWAYRPDRHWPDRRWQELLQTLVRRGEPVVVTHAPADRDWVEGLLAEVSPRPPVFFSPSLKEFAALAARAQIFVTAEGGPMHLAAAVGAPLVVLWGRTPLEVWRPWGVPQRIVRGGRSVAEIELPRVLAALDELRAELGVGGGARPQGEGKTGGAGLEKDG